MITWDSLQFSGVSLLLLLCSLSFMIEWLEFLFQIFLLCMISLDAICNQSFSIWHFGLEFDARTKALLTWSYILIHLLGLLFSNFQNFDPSHKTQEMWYILRKMLNGAPEALIKHININFLKSYEILIQYESNSKSMLSSYKSWISMFNCRIWDGLGPRFCWSKKWKFEVMISDEENMDI
jgi:hypothetical protein